MGNEMKILLINPPRFNGMTVIREDRCESTIPNIITPTGLVILGGILEQKHDICLIDANGYNLGFDYIENYIKDYEPDIIIFKATPETFFSDIKIAEMSNNIDNNIKTILICWSLTKIPTKVLENAKHVNFYILDYNYEKPIVKITECIETEKINGIAYRKDDKIIVNKPDNDENFDFDSIPMPAWHLIRDFNVYWIQVPSIRPSAIIESMKGCGMNCTFCTISDNKPNFRHPKKVVEEIKYLYIDRNVKNISFFDATFNINKKRAYDICHRLIQEDLKGLRWYANIRVDMIDKELTEIMRDAGCRGVSIGVESGSQKILDIANKRIKISDAKDAVALLKNAGIKQYASFIVGLPGETIDTMNQTKNFIMESRPTGFQVNSFVPYPRSKLYDLAISQGKIDQNMRFEKLLLFNSPISLCDLPAENINEFRKKIYKDVYMNPKWWLSNLNFVLRNPEDIEMGVDYGFKVIKRLLKGVKTDI